MFLNNAAARAGPSAGFLAPTFLRSAGATGFETLTLPAHAAGDLLLMLATRHLDSTIPTLPANWTSTAEDGTVGALAQASPTCAVRLGWRIATSSSHTSGTWTNAQQLLCLVYEGVDAVNPVSAGASVIQALHSSATTINYPGLTFTGSRFVISGHKLDGNETGVLRSDIVERAVRGSGNVETRVGDNGALVSAWAAGAGSKPGTGGYISFALAIKGASI